MSNTAKHYPGTTADEDIIEVLTAISVVSRRLARNIAAVKPRKEENRMSKIKLLLDVVEDARAVADSLIPVIEKFKNLAESLQAVADALASTETKAERVDAHPEEPKALPQEAKAEATPADFGTGQSRPRGQVPKGAHR